MLGDLRGNMIDMTSSMAPWACGEQPVPPLGAPIGDIAWSVDEEGPTPAPHG